MKKSFKKSLTITFSIVILFLVSLILYNIISDDFYVFSKKITHNKILHKKYWPNERILKTNYLIQNPDKYDSIWMGASQSNSTNVSHLPYGHWYNTNAAMMSLQEMLYLLKIYKANGMKIKNIVVQLRDDSFRHPTVDYNYYLDKFMIYAWYPITLQEKIKFYTWYALALPYKPSEDIDIWDKDCKINFMIDGSCCPYFSRTNPIELSKSDPKFFIEYPEPDYDEYSTNWEQDVRNIVDYCKKNNIKGIFFIAPETYNMYKKYNLKEVKDIRKKLAKITPYYDFTGNNEITNNYDYFYDHVHYKPETSRLIIEKIFYNNSNFGKYVELSK